jgi:hypothetical protein
VTRAVIRTVANEFKAFTSDFRAVAFSSLAIVEIIVNINVRLRDRARIT